MYSCSYGNKCRFIRVSGSVTTAWRVLKLRMEERPPIWRVAVNILNKQSRTADKGWSSSLGVGRGANASPSKNHFKKHSQGEMLTLETKQSGGKLLPQSDLQGGRGGGKYHAASNRKGTFCEVRGMLGACIGKVHLWQRPAN
jgi:hypothetical protein